MKMLVTGGCGFIGSHLVDRLVADGHAVTVLDNLSTGKLPRLHPSARLVEGDLIDGALVNTLIAQAETVFHLAAVASVGAYDDPSLHARRTNRDGTVNLFDAVGKRGSIPVIYASSAAVYGDNPLLPLKETQKPSPISPYGEDKYENERYAGTARTQYGIPSIGLRFFNVYGPRQDAASPYSGVISKFLAQLSERRALTLFGDGLQTRDFIYIDDVVTLMLAAHRHLQSHDDALVVNGCTGQATNIVQLAQDMGAVLSTEALITHAPARAGDIRDSRGDPTLARSLLGFTATTPLSQGLARLVDAHA